MIRSGRIRVVQVDMPVPARRRKISQWTRGNLRHPDCCNYPRAEWFVAAVGATPSRRASAQPLRSISFEDQPPDVVWEARWLPWKDFGLPADDQQARNLLHEAWVRAETDRVEIACLGGMGRTGTAMACIAVLDGVPATDAVAYVRKHYRAGAVETAQQQQYVERFAGHDPAI